MYAIDLTLFFGELLRILVNHLGSLHTRKCEMALQQFHSVVPTATDND